MICIIVWTQCTYVLVRHCCNAGPRHRRTSDQTTPHPHPPSQRSTLLNKGCLNYPAPRRRFKTAGVARQMKQVRPVPYKETTRRFSVVSVCVRSADVALCRLFSMIIDKRANFRTVFVIGRGYIIVLLRENPFCE